MPYREQHPTSTRHYVGRSVDRKPIPGQLGPDGNEVAGIPDGSVLTEIDTGLEFVFYDNRWNPQRHLLSGLLNQLLAESRKQTALLEQIANQSTE